MADIHVTKRTLFNRNKQQEGKCVSGGNAAKQNAAKNHLSRWKEGAKAMPKKYKKS